MAEYTQTNQPMRVDTVLEEDALLLERLSGEEGISIPYLFELDLVSEDGEIDGEGMLRSAMRVDLDLPDGGTRAIHGLVRRFVEKSRDRDLVSYRAEIVPWLWFLSLTRDCRIFQEMDVLEIVEQVFTDQGYSDFDIRCTRSYPKREYLVQYRESSLDFVSRLLEEAGIFYFFEHGGSGHVLVLADDMTSVEECEGQEEARIHGQAVPDEDVVLGFEREHAVHAGEVTLVDYDYLQPSLHLQSTVSEGQPEEIYDYPGGFADPDGGDRNARLALEREEARRHLVRGSGTCRGFRSGGRFRLLDHFRDGANQAYALLEIRHRAHNGTYRAGRGGEQFEYRNEFVAIPHSVPYRPARRTRKPTVQGSQTAEVVGPSGEEIWVDAHGRVKVQFHWDRLGGKDENSSCWIRVSSAWAGKNWGAIQIPRIGQEVIVDFLEGDPDRPIVTGRVYNAEQTPPYPLPAAQTQSGVKSRSSKGGSSENFNEIRMEDKKGGELIYIHAEKDQQVVVENDRTESVGHNESIDVGNDRTESVGNNESISVGEDQTLSVGGNQNESVGGNRNGSVAKNETRNVDGNRNDTVAKNETVDVGGDRNENVGKKESISIGDTRSVRVGKDDQLNVGKKLVVNAGDQVVLQSGSASIVLKKDGTITIKGKDINLSGSGKVKVKASSDVTIKGSQVKQN